MRKNLVWFGALVSAVVMSSCGGSKNNPGTIYSAAEVEKANQVIKYYDTSLSVLNNLVKEKEVNDLLGYMDSKGKVAAAPVVAPLVIVEADTVLVMNPGSYFNEETRQNLKKNYAGLFSSRTLFYKNYDTYRSYLKSKKSAAAEKLLNVGYQLSVEMSEYKQNIFDILSPFTEEAQTVAWANNPLKEQLKAMNKIAGTMQSIVNLYARKHLMDGARIDLKAAELANQLEAARKLPAVTGYEGEVADFQAFLGNADTFLKELQKARQGKGYTDSQCDSLMSISQYGVSII